MRETERFDISLEGIGPGAGKIIACLEFGFGTSYSDIMLHDYFANNGINTSDMDDIIPFTFVHRLDGTTPAIQRCCKDGRILKKASFRYLTARDGGNATVLTVIMEQVQIISAKVKTLAANSGGPAPVLAVEEVQLVYEKIDWAEGTQGESFLSLEFPAVFPRGEVNERQAAGD